MIKPGIMGAIAGDIIGSIREANPTHNYDFKLIKKGSRPTDDSIMTVAVAEWLLEFHDLCSDGLVQLMLKWGRRYPEAGYGGRFFQWLKEENPLPYNSWGNGSAMRVSPVGFAFNTLEDTLHAAEISASVSHNHPEGIKGAQATAASIFMARTGETKEDIKRYIEEKFGYDLNRTCAQLIANHYRFEISCQRSVPESIIAFLESTDYEDAVRRTVSLGGDADTMGAITGAIAAAYYDNIPDSIATVVTSLLPDDVVDVIERFNNRFLNPS